MQLNNLQTHDYVICISQFKFLHRHTQIKLCGNKEATVVNIPHIDVKIFSHEGTALFYNAINNNKAMINPP